MYEMTERGAEAERKRMKEERTIFGGRMYLRTLGIVIGYAIAAIILALGGIAAFAWFAGMDVLDAVTASAKCMVMVLAYIGTAVCLCLAYYAAEDDARKRESNDSYGRTERERR